MTSNVVVLLVGNERKSDIFMDLVRTWGDVHCMGCYKKDERYGTSLLVKDNSYKNLWFLQLKEDALFDLSQFKDDRKIKVITHVLYLGTREAYIDTHMGDILVEIINSGTRIVYGETYTITYNNYNGPFYAPGYNLSELVDGKCVAISSGLIAREVAQYFRGEKIIPIVVLLAGDRQKGELYMDGVHIWANENCSSCTKKEEDFGNILIVNDDGRRSVWFVQFADDVMSTFGFRDIDDINKIVKTITHVLYFGNTYAYIRDTLELTLLNATSYKALVVYCETCDITCDNDDSSFCDVGYNLFKMDKNKYNRICSGLAACEVVMDLRDGKICSI